MSDFKVGDEVVLSAIGLNINPHHIARFIGKKCVILRISNNKNTRFPIQATEKFGSQMPLCFHPKELIKVEGLSRVERFYYNIND